MHALVIATTNESFPPVKIRAMSWSFSIRDLPRLSSVLMLSLVVRSQPELEAPKESTIDATIHPYCHLLTNLAIVINGFYYIPRRGGHSQWEELLGLILVRDGEFEDIADVRDK